MELFKDNIERHRSELQQNIEIEKVCLLLQQDRVLDVEEIVQIEASSTRAAKADKLLEILLSKDSTALQSFYSICQKLYNQILFSEPTCPAVGSHAGQIGDQISSVGPILLRRHQMESYSTSQTSGSEDDVNRTQLLSDSRLGSFPVRPKQIKSDTNSTISNSFPTFSAYQDKDYEWFFKQFEKAFSELHGLKQQNADMVDMRYRYDQASQEVQHLRALFKTESHHLQQANTELGQLKNQLGELLAGKKQLLEEMDCLQQLRAEDKQELAELRHHLHKTPSETEPNDGLGDVYTAVVDKYENICKSYDLLREKYPELMSAHNSALAKLSSMSEENARLHAQQEELREKQESLLVERNGLKQQCTNAIREWNQLLIKNNQLKDQLTKVMRQRDDYCRDFNQAFARHAELKKSYEALRSEKDAAVKEYALVMSERDSVHKEIEQLQDKLGAMNKHMDVLVVEKKDLEAELQVLRQDLNSVKSERNKYWGERNEINGISQLHMEQRNMAWKERNEAYQHMEQIKGSFEKVQKEKAEELDAINKATDGLKKELEKMKLDLQNAEQEAENANKNRDKAFSERDKIVQERESIRTLCDNLRRDRDRAVSDLAQALRESDEFRRHKNEAIKELKEFKSKYEAVVDKDSRYQQFHTQGHNRSRDSAIDADLHDLGPETAEITVELHGANVGGIGFDMIGGKDDPHFGNDSNLIVSHVSKGGIADGKLRVNDTIMRINSMEAINVDKKAALQALWTSGSPIVLVVRRRKSSSTRIWQPVQIVMACQKGAAIHIERGLYISQICPDRIVTKCGLVPCVGDRVVSINNMPVDSMTPHQAMNILESCAGSLVVDVLRQTSPLSSAGSSPTPTSVGVSCALLEAHSVSSSMNKSDNLAIHSSPWEVQVIAGRSSENCKTVQCSGSQTDSLDSAWLSSGKSTHHLESDKARYGLPMLDKAKEKVEKIFRVRHKSQDRDNKEAADRLTETSQEQSRSRYKLVEDCGTQVNLLSSENVIAEFPSTTTSYTTHNSMVGNPDVRGAAVRRDWEHDSNSGTWPKIRSQQGSTTTGLQTLMVAPGYRPHRERPSIRDVFYDHTDNKPYEQQPLSGSAYPHRVQTSDSSIKTSVAPSVASFQSVGDSSISPVSPKEYMTSFPLDKSGPITSSVSSAISFQKPQSHFVAGVTQTGPGVISSVSPYLGSDYGPNTISSPSSYLGPSQGSPAFTSLSSPNPMCQTGPSHRQFYGTTPVTLPYSHGQGSNTVVHLSLTRDTSLASQLQGPPASRPLSAHQGLNADPSPLDSTPTGHRTLPRQGPAPAYHNYESPHSRFSGPLATSQGGTTSPSYVNKAASGYMNKTRPSVSPSPQLVKPHPTTMRPFSLEVPQSVRFFDHPIYDQNKKFQPANQGFKTPQSTYYPVANTTNVVNSTPASHHSSSAASGAFNVPSLADSEHIRPYSFHEMPTDRYHSFSPSHKCHSPADHFSVTPNSDHHSNQFQPHPAFLDDDLRQAAFRKDKLFERIRIPSSTSVNTKSGSLEMALSDRSSPGSPLFHTDTRESVNYKGFIHSDEYMCRPKMSVSHTLIPNHHETRDITFEKSSKPVGFKIQQGSSGGIFVSSVSENSLAAQAGLVIGDQLLEVCGINMRNANYKHAVTVLRQCGDNLTIKVQYNPEKYTDHQHDVSSSTSISSSLTASPNHMNLSSEAATPKHLPDPLRTNMPGVGDMGTDKRRYVTLKKKDPGMIGPGFSFVGGNAVGIFVHDVFHDCFVQDAHSLQKGDHILEFNSVDMRAVTAETAMIELTRPCATMTLRVVHNFARYTKIQSMPCDSFYIRANFDHSSHSPKELDFQRDDILYVDNTLYSNQLGTWFAWLLDNLGTKVKGGIIPSKIRLEDELVLRRTHSESRSLHEMVDDGKGSRRGSASARRSFFRRKRHQRNNSRDSHEFGSSVEASLSSDSVPVLDDSVMGYTPVEKIEVKWTRPVVLLAPLADALISKLVSESPDKYRHCQPFPMRSSSATMEQSLAEGVIIDYWKEEDVYQCVRASVIKETCDSNVHCLLSVSPAAIDRMRQAKIYPITIFVRHLNAKQIRDIRDPQFLKDRASHKVAKEQFEHFQKIELEYSHLFSVVIQGGNLAEMCMQIKSAICTEQKKIIWMTTSAY